MPCPTKRVTVNSCALDIQTDFGYMTWDRCTQICAADCKNPLYTKNPKSQDPYFYDTTNTPCQYDQNYTNEPICDIESYRDNYKYVIKFFYGYEGRCVCGGWICGQENCMVG